MLSQLTPFCKSVLMWFGLHQEVAPDNPPDPPPSEMAMLASQIAATGALPHIPAIMHHRNQVQNTQRHGFRLDCEAF